MRLSPPRLAVLLVLAVSAIAPGQAAERIIAIGDIHGELEGFTAILKEADLVDEDLGWIGGAATLVQTGDFLDRGARVREVMDLLMALESRAEAAGGRVEVLLGNHEIMNLMGIYTDVSPEAYTAFADSQSEARRRSAYRELVEHFEQRRSAPRRRDEEEADWLARHPPGFLEYQEALGPDGVYGKWLRERAVVVAIGANAFMHAGIPPELVEKDLEAIERGVRDEVAAFDSYRRYLIQRRLVLPFFDREEILEVVAGEVRALAQERGGESYGRPDPRHRRVLTGLAEINEWWSFATDGPMWTRGYSRWEPEEGDALIGPILERYRVDRFIVGHAVTRPLQNMKSRFDGRVFLIDTGMLASHYHGRASALEIRDGTFTAIYPGEREILFSIEEKP